MTTFRRCDSKKLKSARNKLNSIHVLWFYARASFCMCVSKSKFVKLRNEYNQSIFQICFDFISGGFLPFGPTVRRLDSRNWEDESYVTHRKVTFGPLRSSVIETPWKAPKSPLNKSYTYQILLCIFFHSFFFLHFFHGFL